MAGMASDNLLELSDDELNRRIMVVLKRNCDKAGLAYPVKLVAYLAAHPGVLL